MSITIVDDNPSIVVQTLLAEHNKLIADLATTSISGSVTADSISVIT